MIDRIAYDEEASILRIAFRDTGTYLYYDVPQAVYEDLAEAASAGAYFNEHIKPHYRCARDPARRRFGPNA